MVAVPPARGLTRLAALGALAASLVLARSGRGQVPPGGQTPPPPSIFSSLPPPLAPDPVARPSRRWEKLTRRNPGLVLFKARWDPGTLELKEDTLRWIDDVEPDKNLLVPMRHVVGMRLTCARGAPGSCFEWAFLTKEATYRFREATAEGGKSGRLLQLWGLMRGAYPALASTRVSADAP